jgi:8-oxo-dGTP pyrophosphatase MutT (NUDIX family)
MTQSVRKKLSCGVVVVSLQDDYEPQLLLLRAFNNWDFPKGMQEADEQPLDTALREVREETALTDLQFPWGEASFDTGPYSKNKTARYFIGQTNTREIRLPVNPQLGHAEHCEWRWVTPLQARQLVTPRVAQVLDWAEQACPELLVTA